MQPLRRASLEAIAHFRKFIEDDPSRLRYIGTDESSTYQQILNLQVAHNINPTGLNRTECLRIIAVTSTIAGLIVREEAREQAEKERVRKQEQRERNKENRNSRK